MQKKVIGSFGEHFAKELLRKEGYKIVTANFRCKIGEIDMIATKEDILVFVEVKTRHSTKFGLPEEAVNPWKLRKISRTGDYFVQLNSNLPLKRRIDVVSLLMHGNEVVSWKIIKVT